MKKSLLALAVLSAVAGVASAQSSVTLYGLVDIGVGRLDPKQSGVASTTGVVSGIQSGSRVGLRGSEDLGGGLKAIFNLEHGFSADEGTQGQGRMWGRWAYAGIEGSFGQVRLGRQWAAGFELFGAVDPWGTGFNDAGSQSVFSSANALRVNNAIVYRSPIVGGFGAVVGYSLHPGVTGQATTTETAGGSDANNRTITAGLRFGAGPFLGVATLERVAFAGADQQHLQLGATFDAKVVKVHAMFGQDKDQRVAGPRLFGLAGLGNDATNWMAGVTVPIGPAAIIASYASRDADTNTATTLDGRVIAVGGTYSLSRRTNTYLMYSDAASKNVPDNANDRKELIVGLRHQF